MIVIIAMGWFAYSVWKRFGGEGLLAIALAYISVFIAAGTALWRKREYKVAGGVFFTMAVCVIPLAVYLAFKAGPDGGVLKSRDDIKTFFPGLKEVGFLWKLPPFLEDVLH